MNYPFDSNRWQNFIIDSLRHTDFRSEEHRQKELPQFVVGAFFMCFLQITEITIVDNLSILLIDMCKRGVLSSQILYTIAWMIKMDLDEEEKAALSALSSVQLSNEWSEICKSISYRLINT
eukprot:c24901_g1_i2 orf=567-929(+)